MAWNKAGISGLALQGCALPMDSAIEDCMNDTAPVREEDGALVTLAQGGDAKAFEQLVERYKQKAYRIAFDFSRDRDEAKDLSQEAFLRAYTNLKKFDGRSGFYTWFYRILVNICLDHRRKTQRTSTEEFNETVETRVDASHPASQSVAPDQHAMAGQMSRQVDAAVKALPPKQRTAFILKNHQGLSIREIAELMETAEGTVKVHLHRAVAALRQKLAEFV